MTENETKTEELRNAICDLVCIAEDSICRKGFERLDNAGSEIMDCLDELEKYQAMEKRLNGISVAQLVDGFIAITEKLDNEKYSRGKILTNEDADKWEAYKAIGTVERLQDMKEDYEQALSDWRQYRKIGTTEEFKALKEKNEPKKVIRPKGLLNEYYHEEECPHCKTEFRVHVVGYKYTQMVGETRHCPNCGQKLAWQ